MNEKSHVGYTEPGYFTDFLIAQPLLKLQSDDFLLVGGKLSEE
jgi:hypothetical protein